MSKPIFQDWGLIDYQTALIKQLDLVEQLNQKEFSDTKHPGFIIFCSHPPVVTTGRQTKPADIFAWSGDIIEVSRGGRATYHGPSQLVVYPILDLKLGRAGRGPQEIRGYIRSLEQSIIITLKDYGIDAIGKTPQKLEGEQIETDETGVWVGTQKIASIGIAVKKWICFHGAAINLDYDPVAFKGLNPCGFKASTMICIEQILNKRLVREEFSNKLLKNLMLLL